MAVKWSEEEIERLQELTEADYTDKEISRIISEEFGNERTKKAVESKRLDEGFKKIDIEDTDDTEDTEDDSKKEKKSIEEKTSEKTEKTGDIDEDTVKTKKREAVETVTAEKQFAQQDVFDVEKLKQIEKEDDWSQQNILALNYLTSRGLSDDSISILIEKTEVEIQEKRKELKEKLAAN